MRLDGTEYQANDVVELSVKAAKALCEAGTADADAAAVAYCVKELQARVLPHVATPDDDIVEPVDQSGD